MEEGAGERPETSRRRRRRWTFGTVVFDEASWTLLVDGAPVTLEAKPLELLLELCLRAGEIVSKDELLDTVWNGINVVESSIPTAIAKLRRALGPRNQDAIATVTRIGYRLTAPVTVETLTTPAPPRFAFTPGDIVPGRPQWRLIEPLGDKPENDVWRSRHEKTGETRVFKFADTPDGLRQLRREAMVARLLLSALGPDGPFVPLLEWNFETAPYFLESRDSGMSLIDWARAAGDLKAIPLARRIEIAARSARALAAVHDVGVLHKDVKPANILIEAAGNDARVRLADFGSGQVVDEDLLSPYAITPQPADASGEPGLSGTPFYRAPELAVGSVPTVKSDVYSMGLILFQLAVGDFGRVPAPGWEREIEDPLLREDIAAAAAGNPAERIDSAALLADRLERIEERRQEAAAAEAAAQRFEDLARQDTRRRARRPWVLAASAAAAVGIIGTSAAAFIAAEQRDEARHQREIAEASYSFLIDDLLGRADPAKASSAEETIAEASRRASAEIDIRFRAAPLIAGRLHAALARAFDQRTDLAAARVEYAKADAAYGRAGNAGQQEQAITRLHLAEMEALSGDPNLLPNARKLLVEARGMLGTASGVPAVWLASTEGSIALASEDVPAAGVAFRRASEIAETLPDDFTLRQRLNMRQRVAFMAIRMGDGEEAARQFRPLVEEFTRLSGPESPDALNIRLNLIQALMIQKRHAEVVEAATALLPLMEKRYGTRHRRTMQLLAVRQQSLGTLERYAEAAADGERVWRTSAEHEGANAFQAIAGRADTATSQCRAGLHEAGIANARAAAQAARAVPGPETALSMGVRAALADCLIAAGKPAEAGPLLAGIDRRKVSELVGDQNWPANLDLALAEVALAAGDRAEALQRLAAARPVFANSAADPYQSRKLAALERTLTLASR
ncbi:protein kinase domain-containing protein [Sphingobium lignivorans]|uniref:DNA-binding winged helix-turn-helix (WHTH) protein n=1 Tax=Sphingobium lignivorans TaxID=2735886 RepID=A0ABR6NHX7_9SPHN|nr:winged helix-turn-helix domain-containing protein [Sphingobium lignivorans]MBB5986895.1 DNA-binding winged helix-turn-helix (wHTH) protein [Sphingobium lignivorans]